MFYLVLATVAFAAPPRRARRRGRGRTTEERSAWSDQLHVDRDCQQIFEGRFWTSRRLQTRVLDAARRGDDNAVAVLEALLHEDAPHCKGKERGPAFQAWYEDRVQLIQDDLAVYADFPDLLEVA